MAVQDVASVTGPRVAPQQNVSPPKDQVSPGISAYATAYGETIAIYVGDHWQSVGHGTAAPKDANLAGATEWYWGIDNAWHVRNDPRKDAPPDLDNSGHLALDGSKRYLPVIAIDNMPMKYTERASRLAAVPSGLHQFTVLDGAKLVVVERTVPEHMGAPNSPEFMRQLAPYLPNDEQGADVEGFVSRFPRSAGSGIIGEANAFKGPKGVAAATVQVLAEMLKSPNKDAWKEQFVPLVGQVRDHQKVAVPRPLVDRVVAQLPDAVHKYGHNRVATMVRQFIEGAARRTYRDAGSYLNNMANSSDSARV